METKNIVAFLLTCLVLTSLASAILVNADYVTIYPGEEGKVSIEVENNEGVDIEGVSVKLIFENLPFVSIGNSQKEMDDLDDEDDDSVSFTLKASTDIQPGDYDIPYIVKYSGGGNETEKEGSFGLRVSARTDLSFSVETKDAIVGNKGRISFEIINRGLGDLKVVSVEIFPQGYELLSKKDIFIGRIDAEDSEVVNYEVLFNSQTPTLSAKITYKDFENEDKTEMVTLPLKVYSVEEAKDLGMINGNNFIFYSIVVIILVVGWIAWRKLRKKKKKQ